MSIILASCSPDVCCKSVIWNHQEGLSAKMMSRKLKSFNDEVNVDLKVSRKQYIVFICLYKAVLHKTACSHWKSSGQCELLMSWLVSSWKKVSPTKICKLRIFGKKILLMSSWPGAVSYERATWTLNSNEFPELRRWSSSAGNPFKSFRLGI